MRLTIICYDCKRKFHDVSHDITGEWYCDDCMKKPIRINRISGTGSDVLKGTVWE